MSSWFRMPSVATWRWLLAFAMLGLLVLSLLPPSVRLPSTGWDKSNHMIGFATLALLSHWAWPGRTVIALAALLAYGGLIEVLQSFTPNRFAEFGDLIADGIGLLVGEIVARLLVYWLPSRTVH
jgi:VanZ family protein